MGYNKRVPTIIRVEKYSVVIYTNDHPPPHVHVRFGKCSVRVAISEGTVTVGPTDGKPKAQEVRRAVEIVADHLEECLKKWSQLFDERKGKS